METYKRAIQFERDAHYLFRQTAGNESEPDFRYLNQREYDYFIDLIDNRATESEIDAHLRGAPDLLRAFLDLVNTGHHSMKAIPQANIRGSIANYTRGLIPDWLLEGKNSDGKSWWFVELKGPKEKIFTSTRRKGLRFSPTCNEGLNQLVEYLDFAEKNQSAFRDTYKMSGFREPRGMLILGRQADLTEEMVELKGKWNSMLKGVIQIRTWDAIRLAAEEKWAFTHPK